MEVKTKARAPDSRGGVLPTGRVRAEPDTKRTIPEITREQAKHVSPSTTAVALVLSSPPGGEIDPAGAFASSPPALSTLGGQVVVNITSEQLNNLLAAPVTILPAPGGTQFYLVTTVTAFFTSNGAGSGRPTLYYASSAGQTAWNNEFSVASPNNAMFSATGANGFDTSEVGTPDDYINQPIVFGTTGAITVAPGSSLQLVVNYQIFQAPFSS